MIKIYELLKKEKITKKEEAIKVFNFFKGQLNKNKELKKMELDMTNVKVCSEMFFKSLVKEMQKKLDGLYTVELHNANHFIKISFNIAMK